MACRPRPAKAVVLGIIRQESNFDTEAVNSVGARGLMQLMLRTAASEAKLLKQPYSPEALTQRPNTNVLLDSHYLDRLLDHCARTPRSPSPPITPGKAASTSG